MIWHFEFWSPLHRVLATAPLTDFQHLTADRLVQRATYRTRDGLVHITVNFDDRTREDLPARSATVDGSIVTLPETTISTSNSQLIPQSNSPSPMNTSFGLPGTSINQQYTPSAQPPMPVNGNPRPIRMNQPMTNTPASSGMPLPSQIVPAQVPIVTGNNR